MKTSGIRNGSRSSYPLSSNRIAANDRHIQEEFDDLVMNAVQGDSRAVGAIAVAFGPMLLEEAKTVLGEHSDEASDVLQDFFVYLLGGRSRFRPAHGSAVVWMCRIVRTMAETRGRERLRERW